MALGLSLGGGGLEFASDFTSKGCYSYSSGPYAGMAFFGTGGSEEEMAASVASQITAQGASRVPNNECTKSSMPLKADKMATMAVVTAAMTNTGIPEMRCTSVPDLRLTM